MLLLCDGSTAGLIAGCFLVSTSWLAEAFLCEVCVFSLSSDGLPSGALVLLQFKEMHVGLVGDSK